MHDVVWGCAEILPVTVLISPLKKKIGEAFKHNFCPMGKGFECANYQKFLSLGGGVAPGCAGC